MVVGFKKITNICLNGSGRNMENLCNVSLCVVGDLAWASSKYETESILFNWTFTYPPRLDRPFGPRNPHLWGLEITLRHIIFNKISLNDCSNPSQRPLP